MFSASIATLDERAAFIDLVSRRNGNGSRQPVGLRSAAGPEIVTVRGGRIVKRRSSPVTEPAAVGYDLLALAAAFGERLLEVGDIAITPQQFEAYAAALRTAMPRSRRSLYYLTREIFVTDAGQLEAFNGVFAEVFGEPAGTDRHREQSPTRAVAHA